MASVPATRPRDDHVVTGEDGRRVAWSEWGSNDGPVVVLLHRNPGSRLLDPDPSASATVRLITIDRPGYGRTDPVVDPTLDTSARDVVSVLDAIAAEDVAVVGWSGGGMFAIASAAALGNRARSLSLVCTPAPDEEIAWVPDDFRPLLDSARDDPAGALATITAACAFYEADPEALVASDPSPADAEVRARPGISESLAVMMREGARQGAVGMASDIVAGSGRDPLPLDAVSAPARLWYGEADWIGPEHGRWYADRLDGARLTTVPGAGHLLPLTEWRAILVAATE